MQKNKSERKCSEKCRCIKDTKNRMEGNWKCFLGLVRMKNYKK